MFSLHRPCLFGIIVLSLLPCAAQARTWRVERDGSGDFVVIQDAVDAASDGDVIQLGPGRFDEWRPLAGYPNTAIYVLVEKNLSFIGAGVGETIIGPTSLSVHPQTMYEVTGFRFWGASVSGSLKDLTVENCRRHGVLLWDGRLEIDRCEFRDCISFGILGRFVGGGWVRDCQFHDIGGHFGQGGDGLVLTAPSNGVEVARCTFTNFVGNGAGAWWSCQGIDFVDCVFDGGIVGVGFTDGASGSIRNCQISNCSNFGISLLECGTVVVEDNTVSGLDFAGIGVLYTAESLTMRQNVVSSNTWVLYFNAQVGAGDVSNNHFFRVGDTAYWVFVEDYYPLTIPRTVNLENNYWGTTDTALLDQWIYDGNDNEDVDIYVDYRPMLDGPVPTESTTWGAVKSMFQ
jgi:parallel beta-helix repeat protein